MKRGWLFVSAGMAVAAVGVAVAPMVMAATAVLGIGGGLVYGVSRCRHGGRLGLLPPGTAADGTKLPARWFCDSCGRSWPAGMERDRTPIVRFVGYDESKLPAAARRAAALDKQRQTLAVRRAGQTGLGRHQAAVPGRTNVRSIKDRRAG